jgi:exonuclease SbcC
MRFNSIRLRGIGPYREEVYLDIRALPGVLTCVSGPNGAGKSILIGALLGGIYRDVPTRGSLMDLATARDAFVEVSAVNGRAWTIRQTVDPVAKKGECLIIDADGIPVLDDGKVRTADAWVREHMPPVEVLLAGQFGAQGSEGFLAMKPADRKGVLLRLLGVERLEEHAASARERAREARQALAVMEARIGDERARGGDVEALRVELSDAHVRVTRAEARTVGARSALQSARAIETVERRRAELDGRLAPLRGRERELRGIVDRANEIRAAVIERDRVRVERDAADATRRTAAEAARVARADCARLRADLARERERAQAAAQRAERARAVLAQRGAVDAAAESLPAAREALAEAERERAALEGVLERLQGERVAGAEERIGALRGGYVEILHGDGLVDEVGIAFRALEADDAAVRAAEELPERLAESRRALDGARARVDTERVAIATLDRLVLLGPQITQADKDLGAAEAERESAKARGAAIVRDGTAAKALAEREERAAEDAERVLAGLVDPSLDFTASEAERLTVAEAQLAEVEAQVAQLRAELDALPPAALARVDAAEQEVDEAEAEVRLATKAADATEHRLAEAERAAERIGELESERAAVSADLADWNALAAALGRDGVQADLIDAAGPELTESINDLLRNALGSRWTVTIETTRLDSTGKRQLEGLDVRVIDTEAGRDAPVETYSGGERVLLGEAVSLALTMLACRRSGMQGVTLVRDESGAALDPERARQWIAMVRRAAEIVGASRVLLVSHSPEVRELCDSQLVIADGRVEVA